MFKVGIEYKTKPCAACSKHVQIFLTLKDNRIVYLCNKCVRIIGNEVILRCDLLDKEAENGI